MLSKFFIDRPIFATVLSVLITLTGFISLLYLPVAQYPRITPPSISVSINYPGASAQVVADTVAAPIEQQVTGVPGMLYMRSQMGNDGAYTLSVTFDVSVDLNTALVMVQNRVTLAMPLLPTPVQQQGITIRKKTPDILCMVSFISPGGHYDDIYLSNYAVINVKDELLRVDGVSDISVMGQRDYSIRIWLDPQKLASRNMTALDVQNAVQDQNVEAAPGQLGQPPINGSLDFQLPLDTLGRLNRVDQFEDIIVKVGMGKTKQQVSAAGSSPSPSTGAASPMGLSTLSQSSMVSSGSAGSGTSLDSTSDSNMTPGQTTSGGTGPGQTTAGGAMLGQTTSGSTAGAMPVGSAKTGSAKTTASKAAPAKGKKTASAGSINMGPNLQSTSVVRLKDVARVELGALNYNQFCTFDGGPAVGLSIYQLPGTNALDVVERVYAKMRELKTRFPDGLDYNIAYDTTPFIRESVSDVIFTLLEAVALVAIVVLVFLQDWRAMILPMIDVPVSLIGTFAVMALMGYSLNNISLFGLVLAIGIVVDDAIVVLENIERQMAKGYDTRTATIKAMEEISGPILAITLVLCAVFVPCAFISGITGRFFRQFALTISASTVISAINALTMTPSRALLIFKMKESLTGHTPGQPHAADAGTVGAREHQREALPWWIFGAFGGIGVIWLGPRILAALFEMPGAEEMEEQSDLQAWLIRAAYFTPGLLGGLLIGWLIIRPVNVVLGAFFRLFNYCFEQMTSLYGWTIGAALRLCAIVLLVYCGMLVVTVWVFQAAPTGFVPQQDQGRIIVSVQLPDSASLERTKEIMSQVQTITLAIPGVAHTIGLGGISFVEQANGPNFGSMLVILKPFDQRQRPHLRAEAIMGRLRAESVAKVKDARVIVAGAPPIPGLSVSGGFRIMVEDRGGLGLPILQEQTDELIKKIKKLKINGEVSLASVATQFRSNTPQLYMDIDRSKVASLGVSLDDVNQTAEIFLGSVYANSFNDFGRHWQVTLQADRDFRSRIEDISFLQVRNNAGQMVPLSTLVNIKETTGPIFVTRYNLYTAAPTSGSLLPGVSSGDVIAGVDDLAFENLPRSMKAEWTELMFMQMKEGNTTGIVFALAVVCVFLALAALYESWTLPLAVILVVPLCVLFSLGGIWVAHTYLNITDYSLNIFVQIGLVVLVGLACKNAILVVEFAKQMHLEGQSVFEATVLASKLRLRPILMTSFAFILGVVPLCIASGAGSEMRKSLGSAVFSGMLGVTIFGVFLTPVFFYVIQGIGETRLFTSAITQWVGSALVGCFLGASTGYMLGLLGAFEIHMAAILGGVVGTLGVMAVMGVHQRMRTR